MSTKFPGDDRKSRHTVTEYPQFYPADPAVTREITAEEMAERCRGHDLSDYQPKVER